MKKYDLPYLPEGYRWKIVNTLDLPNIGIQKRHFGIWLWFVEPTPVMVKNMLTYPEVEQFDLAIKHTASNVIPRFYKQKALDDYFKIRKIRRMQWWD